MLACGPGDIAKHVGNGTVGDENGGNFVEAQVGSVQIPDAQRKRARELMTAAREDRGVAAPPVRRSRSPPRRERRSAILGSTFYPVISHAG